MIVLTLRPTVINGNRYADDYVVVWRSPQFGRRQVGWIMKASGRPAGSPQWGYHITVPLPVLVWQRIGRKLKFGEGKFRNGI
jgi:hypothetical protein